VSKKRTTTKESSKPSEKQKAPKKPSGPPLPEKAADLVRIAKEEVGPLKKSEDIHPLAIGAVVAKGIISDILANPTNAIALRDRLQEIYNEDPAHFMVKYVPLLATYEKSVAGQAVAKADVSVLVQQIQIQEKPNVDRTERPASKPDDSKPDSDPGPEPDPEGKQADGDEQNEDRGPD